jgi:CubicO group peptidase (beta-lactamase class C family)
VKNLALRLLMVALVLAGRAFCQASGSPSDVVAQYVKAEMARQHIPGISLLVSRNGEIVRAQGFGFSNVELQVPVKLTSFPIARPVIVWSRVS